LVKDEKRKILMSSDGYGIYIIDPAKGTFINFTTKEGLISNQVQSLTEKNGVIYVATTEGLTVITPVSESGEGPEWRVKSYGKPQLIDHVDFNSNAVLFTKKNQIWWGEGGDGILIMDEPKKDTIIPPAYITGIDIMEQPQIFANKQLFQSKSGATDTIWSMNKDTYYVNGNMPSDTGFLKTSHITWDSITGPWNLPVNLSLPYYRNFIRFHFTGTHLGNPEKTRYRYILEGIDKSWSSIIDKPFTDAYRNLSPGIYIFKVSSRGFNGLWSKPAELSFTITPPWWETWWFRTFMGIVFIFILYGIYRWRTATLRRQKRVLEQTVKERTAEVVEEKAQIEKQKDVIQKEKDKSDVLLLNILPYEVAEELKEKGYTTAKSFDEVTILFSDIKGFTHVAERMTAQELVKEIDTYFSAFDRIMQQYGLEKIKTIGDAYIAAGGLPEENTATAKSVVEAAIAMQNAVEEFKKERTEKNLPHFELRIGIHTGPVVAGVVGIKKFQYDIWGDTVNMAARMEQSGVPGKINISQYTYDKVKDRFTCTHRGKIEAKNKGDVDMYFVEMKN
ncbi:MAG TPA: adenylate/guanylate cyclase domain-containing protein, partial [Chitinophagaceae bacterium]|nr:adenylate/guanylate cyclase domain-containing protein [Chitinophagaceae bacterium]